MNDAAFGLPGPEGDMEETSARRNRALSLSLFTNDPTKRVSCYSLLPNAPPARNATPTTMWMM